MLNGLIDFSVKNRLLILLALVALAVGAWLILPKLNLDEINTLRLFQLGLLRSTP